MTTRLYNSLLLYLIYIKKIFQKMSRTFENFLNINFLKLLINNIKKKMINLVEF